MLTTGPTALRWCQRWRQHHRGDGPICGTASLLVLHGGYPRCRRLAGLGRLGSIRPSYTLEVFAARCSTQTPWGVPSVTGDAVTPKSAPSRKHRDGRDRRASGD